MEGEREMRKGGRRGSNEYEEESVEIENSREFLFTEVFSFSLSEIGIGDCQAVSGNQASKMPADIASNSNWVSFSGLD